MHEKETEKARKMGIGGDKRTPYWTIFKKAFPQLFNVFFVFFVTLSLFPSVQSGKLYSISFNSCKSKTKTQ